MNLIFYKKENLIFKRSFCLIFSVLIAVPFFAAENTGAITGTGEVFRVFQEYLNFLQIIPQR